MRRQAHNAGSPMIKHVDDAGTQLVTAAQAERVGARFVGHLQAEGHGPGTRVVFMAANSALLLGGVWGALRAGYAAVVLSPKLTAREREELLGDVSPCVPILEADLHRAQSAAPATLDNRWHSRPMHFTSGTSGRPKGVWSGWLRADDAESLVAEELTAWGISSSDRHLVCGPMSHSAPLRFPLVTLGAGGTVLVPSRFDPSVVARLIESGSVNATFMAPTLLMRLMQSHPPTSAAMRLVAHAGSACPRHVRDWARATFGDAAVREFYGSTEGQFTICTPAQFDRHPGTLGRARPGRALRAGADGRLWCRVPPHARFEYWRDPEATAAAWDGDWFTVGDLGRIDDAGYVYLDGRRSDLIITGGVNVYPAEIERVVADLPGVEQAIAFGVSDAQWGQRVCLAVLGQVSESQVHAFCVGQLAGFKRPKWVQVVDSLPLTHSGKVDRARVPSALGLSD